MKNKARHRKIGRREPLLVLALALLPVTASPAAATAAEELIVFVQRGDSEIAARFAEIHLPRLTEAAEELGLPLRVKDVAEGAPPEITLTPLLVFQNPRGRMVFQGRYADPGKLTHFIRTSRVIPPAAETYTRRDIAILSDGRSRTAAPIKITALTGDAPQGHDPARFQARALAAVHSGFERFKVHGEAELGPTNRLFYMDFHPHLSASGTLSVAVQLFSQFHCIDPVFSRLGDPVNGPWDGASWDGAEQVFAEAGRILEQAVLSQIRSSQIGDGFDAVPNAVPVRSWEELGLALPEAAAGETVVTAEIELPRRWVIEPAEGDAPRVLFRFPPPLERYSGEVKEIRGELVLGADGSLAGARGWAEVETSTVTMGDSILDAAIRGKMLRVASFPTSRFEIERVNGPPLAFGRTSPVVVAGDFRMLGITLPVEVRGQVEPIIGADGLPRLKINATYRIPLWDIFRIEGPEGPDEARNTLVFHLDFLMKEE